MLFTDLKKGESVFIGEAKVTVSRVKAGVVRLAIDADKRIKVQYESKDSPLKKQDA